MMNSTSVQIMQKKAYKAIVSVYGDVPIQKILDEITTIVVSISLDSRNIKDGCSDLLILVLFLFEKLKIKYSHRPMGTKKEPFGVIYKLISPANKVYIGQSKRFIKRMREYKYSKNGDKQPKLHNALAKYGFNNFIISILSLCDSTQDLNDKEILGIKRYNSNVVGYNIRSGGSVSPMSEETKKKLSENNWLKKYGATEDYRKKMSLACSGDKNGFYGKHHTELTKNNLSRLFSGKEVTMDTRKKIKNAHMGKKQTEDIKKKRSLSLSKNVYKIISPTVTEIISNLSVYAKKYGVSPAALSAVSCNKRKHHKNIYVKKIFDGTTGKRLKVGIFGGAMNPITLGHTSVADLLIKLSIVDQVWITPCNNHVFGKNMVGGSHRISMCELATLHKNNIHVFTKEIVDQYSGSTYDFMIDIIKLFPTCDFSYIIGLDNANTFDSWINYEELERLVRFVVIPRTGEKPKKGVNWYLKEPHLFIEPDEPLMEISSTAVRRAFELLSIASTKKTLNQDILNDPKTSFNIGLNPEVREYILNNRMYM